MGQKQGANSVKRQISLPDEKRLKKHCLSGKNQVQPQRKSNRKKNKTVSKKVIKKMYKYTKKITEQI